MICYIIIFQSLVELRLMPFCLSPTKSGRLSRIPAHIWPGGAGGASLLSYYRPGREV